MTIADVSAYGLSSVIDPPRTYRFNGNTREIRKRDVVLVSVETGDGEIGWAPCGTSTFSKWEEFNEATHDDIATVINEIIKPALVGKSIDGIDAVHEAIDKTNLATYLRWQAKSVIDIAIHDILGKRRGAPVYELLDYDIEPTEALTLYPSSGLYLSPEEYVEEANALVDRGYEMYKYRAGLGVDEDKRVIDILRKNLGPEIDIMVDAHAWWSRSDAAYSREEIGSLVEYMGERDVYWVEEPFPSNDYKSYRWLSKETGVPLAAGENEEIPGGLVNMAELGFLSFLQGDVKQHGGFTGTRQAVEFCRGRPVTYVPHNYGTQLGVVANAHLAAAAPECSFVEYPIYENDDHLGMYPFPLGNDIISTELAIDDGRITVPAGPGLGVEVDRTVIEEYSFVDRLPSNSS